MQIDFDAVARAALAQSKTTSAEYRSIVTLAEARATGSLRYFTGKPCKRGHIVERITSSRGCMMCACGYAAAAWPIRKADPDFIAKDTVRRARYYRKNKASIKAKQKVYNALPERMARTNEISRAKSKTVMGGLNKRMTGGITKSLGSTGKSNRSWQALVGYTVEQLRVHIERQFTKGMGWHNRDKWHIDHIIPLASFSFTSPEDPDFKAAWAITNLRPLWAVKNIAKSNKREFLL